MLTFTEVFVVFVMVIIIVMYIRQYYGEVHYVSSKIDGRSYLVRKLPDSSEAADIMARLNRKLTALVQHMVAKYSEGEHKDSVAQLFENYNPEAMSEGGTEIGYTSYSVNKGEKIVMCLRQKDGRFVDENVLAYVAIHELGHLMTDEIGHTKKFWDNFKLLLTEAMSMSLYDKIDYDSDPQSYCGITINSSVV